MRGWVENFILTGRAIMHNGEDVDEKREAVDEGEGTEAGFQGLVLLEDEVVEDEVNDARDYPRQHRGYNP